jgi:hypothetical protein
MKRFLSNMLGAGKKESSCSGKRRYSRRSAEKAALEMAQKHHEPFQSYRCTHCDYWHVGHPLFFRWTDAKKRKNRVV